MAENPTLTLYSAGTPNGRKITVFLEILRIPHTYKKIDIFKGEQKKKWFLKLNPNGQIPVITDFDEKGDEITIFETGAILEFLAFKYDCNNEVSFRFGTRLYWEQSKWLAFQISSHSPLQGQLSYFMNFAPFKDQPAIERYHEETRRIFGVYERRLEENNGWLVGDRLNVADIAAYAFIRRHDFVKVLLDEFPSLRIWLENINQIDGANKGYLSA
ncbi:uncharacterized protein PRCAT00002505001 [Priceomyces carsonii]|uniref:uncharacterized protein n=1 Tax=Priceomyces carsonii TaxID=28549 RepID=UPI002ED924B5|nr:unnamed protein product [Priceomyces carsonii]